jgi:hypothetical protein
MYCVMHSYNFDEGITVFMVVSKILFGGEGKAWNEKIKIKFKY